ncbi:MAG: biotin--[acetyl-CoA-carboxylase] ligase [Planctomycetota bacterium]|jgi:BirA family biotin operon repressor/biotin-[acetyl-CoA-carboxylase] ligase
MAKIDALDPDKIRANLRTKRIGKKVVVYNRTSSTNDIAAEYANNKDNDGLVIFAEEQTAGRGRAGNRWLSGRADSILCSILLTHSKCSAELLALTSAVAVAETIGKVADHQAKIKWPNDIRLGDKKVAGILLESRKVKATHFYIIGIGINCHQKKRSFPPELRKTATSIDIESGTVCDRISLARRLLTGFDHWLAKAEKSSKKVVDQWRKLSIQLGHRVTVVYNRKKFTGNCVGVDPEKGLILQLDTGGIRIFHAAHTTIEK